MPDKKLKPTYLYLNRVERDFLNSDGNMNNKARKLIREYPIIKKELIVLIGETNFKELLK